MMYKKTKFVLTILSVFAALVFFTGCQPLGEDFDSSDNPPLTRSEFSGDVLDLYAPEMLKVLPLTGYSTDRQYFQTQAIRLFVSLLDAYDSAVKAPGTFRFELYERVQLGPQQKGRRVAIWPDLDLIEPQENNRYWRDYLRAYEFDLDFDPEPAKDYVMLVTWMYPKGKRLEAEFVITAIN